MQGLSSGTPIFSRAPGGASLIPRIQTGVTPDMHARSLLFLPMLLLLPACSQVVDETEKIPPENPGRKVDSRQLPRKPAEAPQGLPDNGLIGVSSSASQPDPLFAPPEPLPAPSTTGIVDKPPFQAEKIRLSTGAPAPDIP